jgi:hypothetical protein
VNQRRKPSRSGDAKRGNKPKRPTSAGAGSAGVAGVGANKPVEMWRPTAALPDIVPIKVPGDSGGMLRSLGDPPFGNKSVLTGHYLTSVVERAAGIAKALAASANLLDETPPT